MKGKFVLNCILFVALYQSVCGQTILREVYTNITGTSIANLTASDKFPYYPDLRTYQTNFEAPTSFGDYYGTRMRGYLIPPVSGYYSFWIASDDNSQLFLSTDESSYKTRLIAYVSSYTSSRQWDKETNQKSEAIYLEAGRRYYVEALHKEGSGGDNLAVGWQLPDETYERPIPGNRLQPYVISTNAPEIVTQPADLTISDEESASFYVGAIGAEPLFYQWFRDGTILEREVTSTVFLNVVSTLDNGAKFYCVISNSLGSITSRVATLTVYAETNPPVAISINPPPDSTVRFLSQIEIYFNEPVQNVRPNDLLINGSPCTNVSGFSAGPYLFKFAPISNGVVNVEWSPEQQICDDSLNTNRFSGGQWSYTIDPSVELPQLVITEFMAGNENGLRDEFSSAEDWIEIQNRSPYPVNLKGWSLSDDERVPSKWIFPNRILQPYQFIVVFASGRDLKSSGTNNLHTNFKLSRDGEFLALFSPEQPRTMVSGLIKYPEQRNDISYGLDENNNWVYFETATPGESNTISAIIGVVDPVYCSVNHGVFDKPFRLTLSTTTAGATIKYTTNGSEPSLTDGFIYSGPVTISTTTVFRAAAFKTNYLPSKTITRSYLFGLNSALASLPIMSLVTGTNNLYGPTGIIGIGGGYYSNGVWYASSTNDYHNPSKHGRAWERPVSVEYFKINGDSGFQADAGIRVHGANYIRPRYQPTSKFSFRLYFRGDYGPAKLNYPLFTNISVTTFDQLVLRAGMNDQNPFIRDELARRLGIDEGQVEVSGTFVNLFINGEYKGYYNPTERVCIGTLQAHHGGGEDWDLITFGSVAQEGDTIEWNSLRNFVNSADVTRPEIYKSIMRRFDVTNFVDYLLLKNYVGGGDWPNNNWRSARERSTNGIFRYYLWDDEWDFGYNGRPPTLSLFTNELAGSSEVAQFYKRLILNSEFKQLWFDRTHKHFFNGGALMDENVMKRHNELQSAVYNVITNFNLSIVTNWIPNRRTNLLQQFQDLGLIASSNAPVFSKFGGVVRKNYQLSMSCLFGQIYFTTNGDDPRVMFTADIAPSAMPYTNGNPIRLSRSLTIRARTLYGTNWSAITEAPFQVDEIGIPLKITEIMYNPPWGDEYEFIEIMNYGGSTIDISGFSFTGIDFMFPYGSMIKPWQTYVIASSINPSTFSTLYPGVAPVGYFNKKLSNSGEKIELLDANGNIISSVSYNSGGLWDSLANGLGYSLELIDPIADSRDPANWRTSVSTGGSPENINPPHQYPSIRINEFMASNLSAVSNGNTFPDWIELYNYGDAPVNLQNWGLTDDSNPKRFTFTQPTIINPSEYLILWCDKNFSLPGIHTGFGLKQESQTLRLFDENTNCVDAVTYGFQLTDYSCGRDTNGDWVLCLPTPSATNNPAPVASSTNLFINEILPNALPGESDWIEVLNLDTNLPISLNGVYFSNGKTVDKIWYPAFIPPRGFMLFYADEEPLINHLKFKLPADGGSVTIFDSVATEIYTISYPAMAEDVSRGSYPDGSKLIYNFTATKSPGETNYLIVAAAIRISEILAFNIGSVTNFAGNYSDYIEIQNRAGYSVSLTGCSLSIDRPEKGQWNFPTGLTMPARSFVVVWCDSTLPPMNVDSNCLNTGRGLNKSEGAVYLFGADGKLDDFVEYGNQISDKPIGRAPSSFQLVSYPTPGASNAPAEPVETPSVLRINEWMASNTNGDDWFEIYNPSTMPVDIGGFYLTDDPSISGKTNFQITTYTFIPPRSCIKFVADGNLSKGRFHTSFKINKNGDTIRIYDSTLNLIDSAEFGLQSAGISQGRYPDGSDNIISFPDSPSPGSANYLDSDGDGLPDDWETAHNLNPFDSSDAYIDTDGDGVPNYIEYLCGSNPNDSSNLFQIDFILKPLDSNLLIQFQAEANHSYSVMATDVLGTNHWSRITNIQAVKTSQNIQILIPTTNTHRQFYRVITPAITP